MAMMCGPTPVTVSGQGDSVTMEVQGQTITLDRSVSASGARYVAENDPDTVLWSKGNTATITLKGTVLPTCLARPNTALSQQ
jgi:membrane-bound inhibitor of C-type lysozyme